MLFELSTELITAVKKNDKNKWGAILNLLQKSTLNKAAIELNTDAKKKIFWVNVYNSFFQIIARSENGKEKIKANTFYKAKQIPLFGLMVSFDEIEHGVLRRSKWKYSLGYFSNLFIPNWERKLRVKKLDYRIHFVLNCGAESCPIIFPLSMHNIEDELELATKNYLLKEVNPSEIAKKIDLNQLFLLYLGDFGGKKGLKHILIAYRIISKNQLRFKFHFTKFDKTIKLNNFRN